MFSASQPFTKCNTYTIMAFLRKKKQKKTTKQTCLEIWFYHPKPVWDFFFLPITMYIVHYIYSSSIYYSEHHVNQIMLYISTQKYTWDSHTKTVWWEREMAAAEFLSAFCTPGKWGHGFPNATHSPGTRGFITQWICYILGVNLKIKALFGTLASNVFEARQPREEPWRCSTKRSTADTTAVRCRFQTAPDSVVHPASSIQRTFKSLCFA